MARTLEAVAQISVAVDEPGVEGGRVPLLRGEEGVWRVRGGQGVGGQGVRRDMVGMMMSVGQQRKLSLKKS